MQACAGGTTIPACRDAQPGAGWAPALQERICFPKDNKHEFPVHLCSSEGTRGCVECSVTVPVSSKEATPAEVSQSGHAVPEGSQETGKCGRGHQDGGEPVIQEEWLRELGSFWLGEEKVKEQGSEASGGGVVKTETGTFEACPVTGVGLQPQLARGEF